MKAAGACQMKDLPAEMDKGFMDLTKMPVVELGWQSFPDRPAKLLVNDITGSTLIYDHAKHAVCRKVR
jgi:hypothetical protein